MREYEKCKQTQREASRECGKQVVDAVGRNGKGMMFGASEFAFYRKILHFAPPSVYVFDDVNHESCGRLCKVEGIWCAGMRIMCVRTCVCSPEHVGAKRNASKRDRRILRIESKSVNLSIYIQTIYIYYQNAFRKVIKIYALVCVFLVGS